MAAESFDFFIVTAPGLESVTLAEAKAHGLKARITARGGIDFRGSLIDAARANLWLRTASRVLLRLGVFDAPGKRELGARTRRLPLARWIAPGSPMRIQASATRSRLFHTGLIEETIREAVGLAGPTGDEAAATMLVRIDGDRCTLSIDTSGELLHKRGYRVETGAAPLRETLASAALLFCRYDGSEPFLDPMCGSGTIAIEAESIASHRAPGLARTFALESFPSFDRTLLEAMRADARQQIRSPPHAISASDKNAGALAVARRNAERAGSTTIQFERADVGTRSAPSPGGLLVANPPYGRRIAESEPALQSLAHGFDSAFTNWRAGLLLPGSARFGSRRKVSATYRLDNGGIPLRLDEFGVNVAA